jgi:DNA-binding IclR family transcriptional regulator
MLARLVSACNCESGSVMDRATCSARWCCAAGKTLLANVPDDEMYRLLDLAAPSQAGDVRQFLAELPEIRSRRLAFNRAATFADAFAVATPLLAPDGSLIAAISAAIDPAEADRLDQVGEELKEAVAALCPKYGLNPAEPN